MIGEILCEKMVIVLNKIDLIEADKREKEIAKVGVWYTRAVLCMCTVIHSMYVLRASTVVMVLMHFTYSLLLDFFFCKALTVSFFLFFEYCLLMPRVNNE